MSRKNEWKECAERRLVEIMALRIMLHQLDATLKNPSLDYQGKVERASNLVEIAKEIGK